MKMKKLKVSWHKLSKLLCDKLIYKLLTVTLTTWDLA